MFYHRKIEFTENFSHCQTENGGQRRTFRPGDTPEATFCTGKDKPVAVYAYCNLHGLWKTEIK